MIAGVYCHEFRTHTGIERARGYPFSLMLMVGLDVVLFLKFRKAGWL